MDNDIVETKPAITLTYKQIVLGAVAVLLAVISTTMAVFALQSPPATLDFDTLKSPEDIVDGEVYLIEDMECAGIFMYAGALDEKGTPRLNGDGIFMEKEHVFAYHALALKEQTDGKVMLFVFSVKRGDGELFDKVAIHDAAENATGDKGTTFPASIYAKAKKLKGAAQTAFLNSKAEHEGMPGFENTKWALFEMEYCCDADEDYAAIFSNERLGWLKLSFVLLAFVGIFMCLAMRKEKPSTNAAEISEFIETVSVTEQTKEDE